MPPLRRVKPKAMDEKVADKLSLSECKELQLRVLEDEVAALEAENELLEAKLPDPLTRAALEMDEQVLTMSEEVQDPDFEPLKDLRSERRKQRVILWDRENNCTQWLDEAKCVPSGLFIYVVWNPESKNKLKLLPKMQEEVVTIEAVHSVLRAMNIAAGTVLQSFRHEAKTTTVYFVFNEGNSRQRYAEAASTLMAAGFTVYLIDGTASNYASFLQKFMNKRGDWPNFTNKAPVEKRDLWWTLCEDPGY